MGDLKKENSNVDVLLVKRKSDNSMQSFNNSFH
jgi:hypothetical protein